jgi:hypothetical protein
MRYNTVRLVVTLVLLCWAPLTAYTQQPAKVPRIGFLLPNLRSPCRSDPFAQGLRELGYTEGHNVVIEWRCADGTPAPHQQAGDTPYRPPRHRPSASAALYRKRSRCQGAPCPMACCTT